MGGKEFGKAEAWTCGVYDRAWLLDENSDCVERVVTQQDHSYPLHPQCPKNRADQIEEILSQTETSVKGNAGQTGTGSSEECGGVTVGKG